MYGISIDLGTYSIKFLSYKIDKKSISFHSTEEVVLLDQNTENLEKDDLWELQLKVVKEFLNELDNDYQLLINMPSDICSSRFFKLPIKNKKKAALMVPFKVEEDIPYSLSDCHYAETIEIHGEETNALVNIVRKESFESLFNLLMKYHISPKCLSTDISSYSEYINNNDVGYPNSFAIIDFGHSATRAFFFKNGKLVSNHTSYLAGSAITDSISKSYNITTDEATIYKHQNAFVLTSDQHDQVNAKQMDFSKLMDKTLEPLISEIKRWDIGYRVKFGSTIDSIYICGGTSNIKNIHNYLREKTNINILDFEPFETSESHQIDSDIKFRRKFSPISTLAQQSTKTSKLINLLTGEYSIQGSSDLPIESSAFISTRLVILSIILSIGLFIDTVFTWNANEHALKKVKSLLGNPELKISKADIRRASKRPTYIINKLEKVDKKLQDEISYIQSSIKTNALKNLTYITNQIEGYDVEIVSFSSVSEGDFSVTVRAKKKKELQALNSHLSKLNANKVFVELFLDELKLTITGEESN